MAKELDKKQPNLVPNLNLLLLQRSEKLVKQAHLSAKESARSRRNIQASARIFNKMKLSSPSPLRNTRLPISRSINNKRRIPLSSRLPPKMSQCLNRKPLRATTHRTQSMNILKRRRSSIRDNSKQSYDVILSLLDCRRMEELKDAFISKNHELEFNEFVEVVWKFMNVKKGEQGLAISALLHLFQDIDVNDDNKMQWSEFSDFLAASQRHSSDQEIDLEKYEIDNFKKPFSLRGGSNIQQLKYSKFYDVIAVLMVNSKQITIFNHQKNDIINTIKGHTNYIISCAFLDGFNGIAFPSNMINSDKYKNIQIIMATSGLDEQIIIWLVTATKKKPFKLRTISVDSVHNILYWSNKRKLFVSADMNYNLFIWDHKLQHVIWQNKYHSDMIIDILLPYKTSLLLSASLDATVVAFDLSADRVKFKLNVHKRGLIAMAYKSSLCMLVTAAAEHKLRVSDGIVGRPLAVLQGHAAPVVSMISIPHSPAVVSLDSSNVFKLWDIRLMECIQSIHFGYPLHEISAMLSLHPNHRIIALGSGGMHYLRRRQETNINLVETENICGIFILETKMQILTVHETMIKKWDLSTGDMVKLIRLLPDKLSKSHTIISCSVSNTKKLLLLGSTNGLVAIISIYSGGLVMLCEPKHTYSVIFVGFYKTMIISFDTHGSIFKYAAFKYWMSTTNKNLISQISHDAVSRSKLVQLAINEINGEYTIAYIHQIFGILIVGTETGLLRFVCLTNDKVILDVNSLNDAVTSIILKDEDNKLFTTDKSGNICCWQLPKQYPARKQFFCKCLYRVLNEDDLGIPITTFCVKTVGKYIMSGDGKGLIKIWCVEDEDEEKKHDGLFNLTQPHDYNKKYQCKLMKTIHSHSDWINNIVVITEDTLNIYDTDNNHNILCIISSSLDGKLFAWKLNGQCIGHLIYPKKTNIIWNVPIDVKKKQNKELQHAFKLFKKMQL